MRPILPDDVNIAARALLAAPMEGRERLCRRMIVEADAALVHVNRTGVLHPAWGNGSLTSAARKRRLAPPPEGDDLDYCRCMETVVFCLIEHQATLRH
ncbi:MAG: hypothetical protein CML66_24735 [Rhodobacteraceae bacterium]|nr:hypothetical protein [Paracoccaceae bacterium]MAY46002.1 hypothetical protein [Paracoccaceae bacterium]QEW19801.1 hypothetical protein LA6_001991 [Marinibacterium anthonyi]